MTNETFWNAGVLIVVGIIVGLIFWIIGWNTQPSIGFIMSGFTLFIAEMARRSFNNTPVTT